MLFSKIDHIGIAVENLELSVAAYQKDFELEILLRETVTAQKTELVFLKLPGTTVELLAATEADSAIGRFIAKRGPGLHHICYEVPDVEDALADLAKKGYRLIDEKPRPGAGESRIAFVHPSSCGGVLTEICDYKATTS